MNRTVLMALGAAIVACSQEVPAFPTTDAVVRSVVATDTVHDADAMSDANPVETPKDSVTVDAGPCTDGERACLSVSVFKICQATEWLPQKCPANAQCAEGFCGQPASCSPGVKGGCDGYANELVCTADGKALIPKKCPGKQQCAMGSCKDVVCTPKSPECTGKATYHLCRDDGQGWDADVDCKSGAYCLGGTCVSLCETNLKVASNVGCEYWSADLDNDPSPHPLTQQVPEMVPHSVVIANPGIYDATLTFTVASACADKTACQPSKATCGAPKSVCQTPEQPYTLAMADPVVPKGETREFKLPVMNVTGSSVSSKGIQVKSTQPVVAFQFNPFDSENAASNDGSLLLPQNTLGKLYFAVSLPSTPDIAAFPQMSQKGFLTVVATLAGTTTVTVTPTTAVIANPKEGVPQDGSKPASLAAGKPWTFALQRFEVLNLESVGALGTAPWQDLTGTRIQADKPVAVFSGHENSGVHDPDKKGDENFDTCCTEHLEEQLMPAEAWGSDALCVKTKPRGYDKDLWVVVAGQDNVTLQTEPSIKGLDGVTLAQAGMVARAHSTESFELTATGKVQVVQFLVGQGQTTSKTGDPSMMLVPPRQQYRTDYVVRTADGFGTNWLTVTRPKGLDLTLDGAPLVANWTALGQGTWEYAWVEVKKGTRTIASKAGAQPGAEATAFGLMVYGYGSVTAYGYPGGMHLAW